MGQIAQINTDARLIGLSLVYFGGLIVIFARCANPYFTAHVVLPREIVADGLYRYLRHPGYLGMGLYALGVALVLGRSWALFPLGGYWGLLAYRAVIENDLLYSKPSH